MKIIFPPIRWQGLFLSFLLSSLQVSANEAPKVLLMTMEQPPYGYLRASKEPTGFLYEIMNKIFIHSKLTGNHSLVPTKRLLNTMLNSEQACALVADSPVIKKALI